MLTTWFRVWGLGSACKMLSRSPTEVRRFKVDVDASLLNPLSLTGIVIGIGILRSRPRRGKGPLIRGLHVVGRLQVQVAAYELKRWYWEEKTSSKPYTRGFRAC